MIKLTKELIHHSYRNGIELESSIGKVLFDEAGFMDVGYHLNGNPVRTFWKTYEHIIEYFNDNQVLFEDLNLPPLIIKPKQPPKQYKSKTLIGQIVEIMQDAIEDMNRRIYNESKPTNIRTAIDNGYGRSSKSNICNVAKLRSSKKHSNNNTRR
jgi:hypothetical protein